MLGRKIDHQMTRSYLDAIIGLIYQPFQANSNIQVDIQIKYFDNVLQIKLVTHITNLSDTFMQLSNTFKVICSRLQQDEL